MTPESTTLDVLVVDTLDEAVAERLAQQRGKREAEGDGWFDVWFASLPRKIGREGLPARRVTIGEGTVDLGSYRVCDLAAAILIRDSSLDDDAVATLYYQGDAEERRMVLKALALLETSSASAPLLVEAHRTNDQVIFEAAIADSDLPARVLSDDDYANAVLKAAFVDIETARMIGIGRRATTDLSRMLLEFMTEREAAGRPVWPGSLEVAAHAPCPGVADRVLGDLWHGMDRRRLAAARAASTLATDAVRETVKQRLDVEPVEAIREELRRVQA